MAALTVSRPESFNPYAAPQAGPETPDPFHQSDRLVREQFIDCEANVRTIGGLLQIGGLIVAGVCGVMTVVIAAENILFALAIPGLLTCCGIGQVVIGFGVNSFRTWARPAAAVNCALWMLAFPVGTIIGGASLWYLVRPAARYVFSAEYPEIIHNTPGVHFRTSAVSLGLLVFVVVIAGGIIFIGLSWS